MVTDFRVDLSGHCGELSAHFPCLPLQCDVLVVPLQVTGLHILTILTVIGLLIYLAYRGLPVLVLAPALAAIVALLGSAPPLGTYTRVFMPSLGKLIVTYFPIFLLGAIFGKLVDASGSAASIVKTSITLLCVRNAIPAIVLARALLTYSGVPLFVVAFVVYPLAAALFQRADIPKRLIPGAVALGAFTFTMTTLPGTPAIQNAIPMPCFGTTAFAVPRLGVIAGLLMFGFGIVWLSLRASSAIAAGEGYSAVDPVVQVGETAQSSGSMPYVAVALTSVIAVFLFNCLLSVHVIPRLDTAIWPRHAYGVTTLVSAKGI